jgi:diguanylate cyclase (GGDEF)-like protein
MRLAKYFFVGLSQRITLFFVTSTLLSIFIMASIGYVKLYEVTSNNSLIRINRAASASVALFSERFQSEFMATKLEGNNVEVIFLKGDTADVSLSFRSDYDAVLKDIGAINQGAANLFKYNSESRAFDRFATTFRKPDGSMPPPMSIGLGHPAYDNIINGREHIGEVPVMGRLRLAHLVPILALDQSVLGILAVDVGWVDDLIRARNELRNQSLLIATLIFTLQSIFGILYLNRETHPLRVLTEYAIDLANRKNVGNVPYGNKHDEIGSLAKGLKRVSALQEKLNYFANFDVLTGLPNRNMFYDKLEDELKKSDSSGLPVAVMLLDVDRFKEVNDKLGHAQGDLLLVEAARRITACVRETDTVARLGGDEFTIILSEMKDVHRANHTAQNIIESLAVPFQLLEDEVFVSASLGITFYPTDTQSISGLFTNADQAMYLAKNLGKNGFCYFTAALQEAAQTRLRLISDLRGALPGKQFALHYQPITELASGKIYKAEALLRWQHPERGLVSPAEFIPVAEETGFIHEIGDWVFHEAIRDLAHWRELFVPELQISVNVSPVQFREDKGNSRGSLEGVKKNWLNQLDRLGLPGESLVIEVTEGVFLDEKISVSDKFLIMRDAGIQVALDDFGTGYSSLSYLKKLNIDYLKIDQSFVQNLENDTNDQALCEAIIVMAHKLGLKVIAEGVETERQRDILLDFGCDYAQGWLYSKALPADEFEVLLKEQG